MQLSKKIFLIACYCILLIGKLYSQKKENALRSNDYCIKQYDILIDGYYGIPYLMGNLYHQTLLDSFPNTIKNPIVWGHVGGRVEYMQWDNIGLGLEYSFAKYSFNYEATNGVFYKAGIKKQRIVAKFNYHFSTTEAIDPYFTAGLGYTNTIIFSEEPNVKSEKINIMPVSIRAGIGIRYFITDFIGVHAEAGLGGPLLQLGITFKY